MLLLLLLKFEKNINTRTKTLYSTFLFSYTHSPRLRQTTCLDKLETCQKPAKLGANRCETERGAGRGDKPFGIGPCRLCRKSGLFGTLGFGVLVTSLLSKKSNRTISRPRTKSPKKPTYYTHTHYGYAKRLVSTN